MARKPIQEEHDSHDRWLLSYADFITLMFALFVVLYAMSSVQEMKFQQLSKSLGSALGSNNQPTHNPIAPETIPPIAAEPIAVIPEEQAPVANVIEAPIEATPPPTALVTTEQTVLPPEPALKTIEQPITSPVEEEPVLSPEDKQHQLQIQHERVEMTGIASELQQRLSTLVSQGKVRVTQSNWGISVEINASILFAPAEAKLNPNSIETLQSIAEVLKNQPQLIHVEGHTDDKAIKTNQFPSNWELSAARAGSVIRLFINTGIEAKRLAAIGYADNKPLAPNDSAEGRLRNRRVQLMIMANSTQDVMPKIESTAQ
jgi:chemotaxis protein MotB